MSTADVAPLDRVLAALVLARERVDRSLGREQPRMQAPAAKTGTTDTAAAARQLAHCLALSCSAAPAQPEPVRTLHHFSCSGGTLLSKCIAALPNVQLLSEVDPFSTQLLADAQRFSPTDMVTLLRQSTRGARPGLIARLFAEQVRVLHDDTTQRGLRLLLRDHAHSHFCHGPVPAERPTLRELMPAGVPALSLVTTRHPLDSFASLTQHGWVHFQPGTLDEYCRRYLQFLDRHADVPWVRYEDFVAAPQPTMQRICDLLSLRYWPGFVEHSAGLRVSGDSGRSGGTIAARPSQPAAVALEGVAAASAAFGALVQRLGYGTRAGTLA